MRPEQTSTIVRSALGRSDILDLTNAIKRHMHFGLGISSFVFANEMFHPVIAKIQRIAEHETGSELLYLNDFYLYTDSNFQADWHIDTEMFSFDRAVNVWIPLDEAPKLDPLAFISGVNDRENNYFHSISSSQSNYQFMNLVDFAEKEISQDEVESSRIRSGDVTLGDLLLLNPRRFHRTNCQAPKHAFIIKFVIAGKAGLRASQMVPSVVWPEVELFDGFMDLGNDWSMAMMMLNRHLADPAQREKLTAGFFPDQFNLFRHKITELISHQANDLGVC